MRNLCPWPTIKELRDRDAHIAATRTSSCWCLVHRRRVLLLPAPDAPNARLLSNDSQKGIALLKNHKVTPVLFSTSKTSLNHLNWTVHDYACAASRGCVEPKDPGAEASISWHQHQRTISLHLRSQQCWAPQIGQRMAIR